MNILKNEIKYLSGVGDKKAAILNKEVNIYTLKDLLFYFPYKYIDKSKIYPINEINSQHTYVQLRGKIINFSEVGVGRSKRLTAVFSDGSGTIELVWFKGSNWIQKTYQVNTDYIIFGRPSLFGSKFSIAHPEIESPLEKINSGKLSLEAQYSTTEKMKTNYINSKTFNKLIRNLFLKIRGKINETIPEYIKEKYNLISLESALYNIHFPKNQKSIDQASFRIKFEEIFFFQLNMLLQKIDRKKFIGFSFSKVGDFFNNFYSQRLPFELTNAQKKVIKEIRTDMKSGIQMNRLLQGDVGSGKTLVALMCMLISLDNEYQACLMAPTEILANQHFETLIEMVGEMGISIELLTGSTKKSIRKTLHQDLQSGKINILIGTHALIEDTVIFKNLGLVVIDEQHRFGVVQRSKLWKKNIRPPHVLVMTATPIPRTLAMTFYGDLDVSIIDELPPGRKPIKTVHNYDSHRLKLFGFLKDEIKRGRQVYIVYPLIRESEKMDYKDLEDGYDSISRVFPPPEYGVSILHGKMRPEEKDKSMLLFANGKTHIMVATTVIEVGVNVPNASVMVIESVERFGLSQLHQLRGRVGRGAEQSYCILMSGNKLSTEARKRIEIMCSTNDGFKIAEEDLKLRGPGDLEGTQQSGQPIDLKLTSLSKDNRIIELAREVAQEVLNEDPNLSTDKNLRLKQQIKLLKINKIDYSVVS